MITLEQVRETLHENRDKWLLGTHQGNDGNQGNTLEELLGVEENNLQLPDLGDIEHKTQKVETGSFVTLFHKEPKPRASIPRLLKCLGWQHRDAGKSYPKDEMSFRSTTYAHRFSDRGFSIDLVKDRIEFIFDPNRVNLQAKDITGVFECYGDWLSSVESRVPHYSSVLPVYWDRVEFDKYCMTKLNNTLMCNLETKKIQGKEYFRVVEASIYNNFKSERLNNLFTSGDVVIDFDARTRHNHGTKLRVKNDKLGSMFEFSSKVF
jgi:hypothetical protein